MSMQWKIISASGAVSALGIWSGPNVLPLLSGLIQGDIVRSKRCKKRNLDAIS